MIERIAERMVAWQISRHYLKAEDQALYQYAFGLLIGQAVNLLIACLLAVVLKEYRTVFVFLLFFIPLRSFAGGHHADNYTACTVLSALMLLGICIMAKLIPEGAVMMVNLVSGAVCGVLVCLLAPVEDRNKPLDQTERRHYGICSRIIWGAETLAWILCYRAGARKVSLAIALGHLALSVLLCAGIVKNRNILKSGRAGMNDGDRAAGNGMKDML
ncbi:hypothetical protein D3Z50_03455 [Clostridiaceae bacterium]|nr:accessory gene regulator B family protein [Clostridium sp.]NBI70134.1 hypothetical protein [Clostridiaceae bacterium]